VSNNVEQRSETDVHTYIYIVEMTKVVYADSYASTFEIHLDLYVNTLG